MKVIGWIGVLHVITLMVWMIINSVFSIYNPVSLVNTESIAEAGIAYYSEFRGFLGLDHGSKSLVMLLSISLPIGLFVYLKEFKNNSLSNLIALIAGCLGFAFYSLSLMLQAATVEYAFKLYQSVEDEYTRKFATLLYEWSMLEGGLSVSIYILANVLLAVWAILHSISLYKYNFMRKLGLFGYLTGGLLIIGHLISWYFLMQGTQNMHLFNEGIGLLLMGWILVASMKMIRGEIRIGS